MSLATSEPEELKFLARFEHVWASLRRYQIRQGLAWSLLTAVLGLTALVAADYRLELPWSVRAAGLVALAAVILAVLWVRVISPLRWWTKPRTAAEIESRFPQLGQRIRTVVQYAGLSGGADPLRRRDPEPGGRAWRKRPKSRRSRSRSIGSCPGGASGPSRPWRRCPYSSS